MNDPVSTKNAPVFDFGAGALCLDFTNTLPDRSRSADDKLGGYGHLVAWGVQSGTLDSDEADGLIRAARRNPDLAARAMRGCVALREAVYRIFSSRAGGAVPAGDDLARLNRFLKQGMAHLRIDADDPGFRWRWSNERDTLERVVWPVARSAGDLLVSDDARWVRECASNTCSWLFLDTSRTRRRKWCDMSSCGNRAKARRHYRRKKASSP